MLIDIVSKNGNLLLNIPVKSDGTIDPTERSIVEEIGHWMQINGESIYGTRPWVIYGEGPSTEKKNAIKAQGFNEGNVKLGATDVRFNKKGNVLYVSLLGVPQSDIVVKALGKKGKLQAKPKKVELLGSNEKVSWYQAADGLHITQPKQSPCTEAIVYKVTTNRKL